MSLKRLALNTRRVLTNTMKIRPELAGAQLSGRRWQHAQLFPQLVEDIQAEAVGEVETFDYRIFYSGAQSKISPWHDIPLGFVDVTTEELLFNYVNEIPRGARAKMECATKEEWNPIKQDTKKGKLRFFAYGDLPFNYGFIPQTWEDPGESSPFSDVSGLGGDNDPVDVVEVSAEPLPMSAVTPVKVLALLGLIDEGETDWKIIALRADHPLADQISTLDQAQELLGLDLKGTVLDWFTNYKVPDGKPQNVFTHGGEYQSKETAVQVIEECHRQWYNLMQRGSGESGLDLKSIVSEHVQDLSLGQEAVSYPRYDRRSVGRKTLEGL